MQVLASSLKSTFLFIYLLIAQSLGLNWHELRLGMPKNRKKKINVIAETVCSNVCSFYSAILKALRNDITLPSWSSGLISSILPT